MKNLSYSEVINQHKKENKMQANKHLELLGLPVQDLVTKFKGVVTGINFDLYGCVQAIVTAEASDGKTNCGEWFDVTRLKVLKNKPVMKLPDFDQGYVAEGRKGASIKPAQRQF